MDKLIFLFLVFFNFAFSLDLTKFEDRQMILQDIKTLILYEESIAKAYESNILENYAIPSNYSDVKTLIGDLTLANDISNTPTLDTNLTKISYNLKDEYKQDTQLKTFYESNTYRKRTYFRKNDTKISFMIVDDLAKHLYDLIKQSGKIFACANEVSNCQINDHIYIGVTEIGNDNIPTIYQIAFHIDNFKKGPIIISTNHAGTIFNTIPKGALLYDTDGKKYVKTLDGIAELK